jgi:hypothetical protein
MTVLTDFSKYPATRFIETGTGSGETLANAASIYPQCYSVELDLRKYEEAHQRFVSWGAWNAVVYLGKSSSILCRLIDPKLKTVFWLDAHFTEMDKRPGAGLTACPILDELRIIIGYDWTVPPIILIDDFSAFEKGLHGWPRLEELDRIMVGWHREMVEGLDVFQYVKE